MKKILTLFLLFFFISFFIIYQGIYIPKNSLIRKEFTFNIEKGQGSREIALNLQNESLIKNSLFFRIYVLISKKAGKLQAGTYQLSPSMTIPQIVDKFVFGQTLKFKIVIPEGFTLKQVAEALSSNFQKEITLQFSTDEFQEEFDFLKEVPNNESLEGFLFPDSYLFDPIVGEKEIVKIFLKNFDKKFNEQLKEETKNQQKSIFEIVTMASLLEKEVRIKGEKELVAGILWKRIEANVPLQVDATILYIINEKKNRVSYAETQIDSPYNTYKYRGLPKGPISNPGLESISAALYPKESDYWYYLSTPDGKTIFSRTLEEHNIAKAKYLN